MSPSSCLPIAFPADSPDAQRFVNEARITGQLQHPGIPAVHQVGTLPDGRPFLAMKLIKGNTLDAIVNVRADPSAERGRLLGVFEAICQAVGYAHAHRVIHRDIKPANVMVGAFGEVQVMDWGLAKTLQIADCRLQIDKAEAADRLIDSSENLQSAICNLQSEATQAGQVLGTQAYMAPEQARGEAADARADVFALGGILCAILTGQPPFGGKGPWEVVRRAAAADLVEANARLDACGAGVELVALCRRCLSPVAADRPADGLAVADELT